MTTRVFTDPRPQQFRKDGLSINSGGKLYFYEPGANSTTLKSVYADKSLTIAYTNPVILDSAGRYPTIYMQDGDYSILHTDSADVQIWRIDNYQPVKFETQFSDWNASFTYSEGDFVRYTDGNYYNSLRSGNLNNTPSSNSTFWDQSYFISQYNTQRSYSIGDVVFNDGVLYAAIAASTGVTPSDNENFWRVVGKNAAKAGTIGTTYTYYRDDSAATDLFSVESAVAEGVYESVGPSGSGADNIWNLANPIPSAAKMIILHASVSTTKNTGTDERFSLSVDFKGVGKDVIFFGPRCRGFGGATREDFASSSCQVRVPINENGVFEVMWSTLGTPDGSSVSIYHLGYEE